MAEKVFHVALERSVVEEASVEVSARSAEEAREKARLLADDGMVAWIRVNAEFRQRVSE